MFDDIVADYKINRSVLQGPRIIRHEETKFVYYWIIIPCTIYIKTDDVSHFAFETRETTPKADWIFSADTTPATKVHYSKGRLYQSIHSGIECNASVYVRETAEGALRVEPCFI